MSKKVCLIILDGWGIGRNDSSNAIYVAHTPFADHLNKTYPHAQLRTDGENVGLPDGQMGNSEVGHMNIGAGRVVYQDLVKINIAVRDKSFHENEVLKAAIAKAKSTNCKLHFIGLVSDGGVHSHIDHLKALCDMANETGVERTYVHAFTDGRDTDPQSGLGYMTDLENHIAGTNVKVASVIGRYYAMDRDKRWERVSKAYQLLVHGKGNTYPTSTACLEASYAGGITDEFVEPSLIQNGSDVWQAQIEEGDVVICFNYRTDRCREITQALTQQNFPEFGMNTLSLHYVTMTNYDETFKNVHVAYDKDNLVMTLGEVLEQAGKSQIRIAETEKYPHVTFFFSGGREAEFNQERRLMVNSPKVATYDMQPEMSAQGIADSICTAMDENPADFICLNFANPDMVGHTGVFSAIVKAVETTDACLKQVVEKGLSHGYSLIVIADHGNADYVVNEDGTPNTAHTTNPVPVWILDPEVAALHNGKLADVAPTVLKLLGVSQPEIMTGKSLF
jgi:2,3-bisphosphoglycerate-independent phosphoglycerate mutase